MAKIKTFKLVSGEEIIGLQVETLNPNELILEKVRMIIVQPNGSIATIPYSCLQQEGKINFAISAIVAEFGISKSAEDGYLQEVSGIALA